MLTIAVHNQRQNQQFVHAGGPLEFGRGPQRRARRVLIEDLSVSRDHLRVEELPEGRVRLENLSTKKEIAVEGRPSIGIGACQELDLPLRLALGDTLIELKPEPGESFDTGTLLTVSVPLAGLSEARGFRPLSDLGEAPAPENLAHWLETVISLQRLPAGSGDFHEQTARALVDLVGLDQGLVLLRREEAWRAVACHPPADLAQTSFSRTLLTHVLQERRTFYQSLDSLPVRSESLGKVEAVVVSPIFGVEDEVVGALYGTRNWRGGPTDGIRPLQAQVVQLLAAAVGANLVRTLATRTRVQFEQFFSPELVRELERNPDLLEGRDQEVTILVSDLRGFTRMAQQLGPQTTCRLVRDMMERLTEQIARSGGVIVDYAGDGILAMWNAPTPQPDHAVRACRTALDMLAEMPALNERWQKVVGGLLELGVGINTGMAQVGNTGSSRKFKYGPHGHTVNLASRVQDATKKMGLPLLITASTRERLPAAFATRCVGQISLTGVAEPVALYELCGDTSTQP
ncbi:MAG: adenylate/guanylate cyclase domain-containing protein [Planctomycetes bacterium]|nr:adenylate/guanylate cyclase domain-containing protein [Planctomycetota bacterium]